MTTHTDTLADELMAYRGLAPTSAFTYSKAIRLFGRWCDAQGTDLANVGPSQVARYQDLHRRNRESMKILQLGLRHYWVLHPHAPGPDPLLAIRLGHRPHYRCRALSEADATALEAAAAARGDKMGLAVLLGLYMALRRAEIAGLRWEDLSGGWLRIYGKGGVQADLPVHPIMLEALAAYPRDPSGWLFPGRRGGPVCPTTVWTWVRRVAREAGVDASTHVLRHTALATANDATKDLRGTQDLARHARPETTSLYTRVRAKRLVQVAMSIDYRTPSDQEATG